MCGRFAVTARPEEIEAHFLVADLIDFPPLYNIAPTQPIHVVMPGPRRPPGSNLPERRSLLVRWGFIPGWAKDPKDLPLLINARSETAADKAAFRAAMRHRRVLIPATGFYEWKREGKAKQAYYIRPSNGGVLAFAGLMETWAEPGGAEIDTAAILTTAANAQISAIHDRMPVIIRPDDYARWLDCEGTEPRDVADLLSPVEPGFLEAIPVSDLVNKVANTGPAIQERAEPAAAITVKAAPAPEAQMQLF